VQPFGSSQHFMEPEGSSPSLQELSTCTYPEPDQSSPQHSLLSLFHVPNLMSIFLCIGPLSKKIRPGPRLIDPFRNEFVFYGEGLLAPRPTPKLEDHPLSLVRGCLFNIFAANFQLEAVPSIRNPRTRHAVVTRGPN
jgi:hypothetical protein